MFKKGSLKLYEVLKVTPIKKARFDHTDKCSLLQGGGGFGAAEMNLDDIFSSVPAIYWWRFFGGGGGGFSVSLRI